MQAHDISPVKKAILIKLLRGNGLRYRDAMPAAVANDLYNYHLQHLLKLGYVAKQDDLYVLTRAGQKYVQDIQPISPNGDQSELFRVNVLLVLMKHEKGETYLLNQTRKRHPYFNDRGVIGGAVKPGELVESACARVLKRETGLQARFKITGIIRKIRYTKDNFLFSDMFYHIGLATTYEGTLVAANEFGENYWVDYDTAIANEQASMQGGESIIAVLRRLRTRREIQFFYYQEKMTIDL